MQLMVVKFFFKWSGLLLTAPVHKTERMRRLNNISYLLNDKVSSVIHSDIYMAGRGEMDSVPVLLPTVGFI